MLILRSFFGAANLGRLIPVRRFTKGSSRLFDLDIEFYCNPQNRHVIEENLNRRGYEADLDQLSKLWDELKVKPESNERLRLDLLRAVARLPNATHPDVLANATGNPVTVETVGEKPAFDFVPRRFEVLMNKMGLFQADPNYNVLCGERTYFLRGDLAHLEQALVHYTFDRLLGLGFTPVTVPDVLHPDDLEACGMATTGQRSQVYRLKTHWGTEACLSGTSEMSLANLYRDQCLTSTDLPIKMVSVSRCYRAEISSVKSEKGLFRVHAFNKVEMFGIAPPGQSDALLEEFAQIQCDLFTSLGLHFMVLDMPPSDLGQPAYRKFDIEAWMPGHRAYGEISSASDCTDYQSRRLGITCRESLGETPRHVSTANGTACAVPRMLIALVESNQRKDNSVLIPEVLRSYMGGRSVMEASALDRTMRWLPFYFMENQ
ncbi:hypothetical protein HPB47_000480 [Ixodes persulcatus]|uniref:Uncharacterized protein n=1 Tax=Ixodes persulcatus TaxID=34615 RepID=A0AC60PT57_IXOPE|nr:hypothetical protein HPB47_000480 [Ixodes persulcatus]